MAVGDRKYRDISSLIWAEDVTSVPPTGFQSKTAQAKTWPVATCASERGETKEAFLLRIAPEVAAWTAENQAKACAFVATDGQRRGLKLITLRS